MLKKPTEEKGKTLGRAPIEPSQSRAGQGQGEAHHQLFAEERAKGSPDEYPRTSWKKEQPLRRLKGEGSFQKDTRHTKHDREVRRELL